MQSLTSFNSKSTGRLADSTAALPDQSCLPSVLSPTLSQDKPAMTFQELQSEPVPFLAPAPIPYGLQDGDTITLLLPPTTLLHLQQCSLPLSSEGSSTFSQGSAGNVKEAAEGQNRYERRQGSQKGIQRFISKKKSNVVLKQKSNSISFPPI